MLLGGMIMWHGSEGLPKILQSWKLLSGVSGSHSSLCQRPHASRPPLSRDSTPSGTFFLPLFSQHPPVHFYFQFHFGFQHPLVHFSFHRPVHFLFSFNFSLNILCFPFIFFSHFTWHHQTCCLFLFLAFTVLLNQHRHFPSAIKIYIVSSFDLS